MPGPVRRRRRPLRRRPRPHVLHHPAEGALVDLPLRRPREGHPGMLQLVDRRRRLPAQIFDRVLVAEPVRALDRVVHVPGPMVRPHVAERRRDPALRGDGVRPGREHLGDAGGPKPLPGRPHRRPQPRPAGADDDDVVAVVDDLVGGGAAFGGARGWGSGLGRAFRLRDCGCKGGRRIRPAPILTGEGGKAPGPHSRQPRPRGILVMAVAGSEYGP